jgi:type I restriction enzyme, R subunit
MPAGPHPFPDFPSHDDLTARYAKDIHIDIGAPEAAMLFMADAPAYNKPRYFQDAAIRAAFEKVLQCQQSSTPPRALLSLATGAGKTVIAANLLWRLHEAGQLAKPALLLCDRDELQ